jgi:hypothetical protein
VVTAGIKTGHLEIKIEVDTCKLLQCFAEQPAVPGGNFGQAIIGDRNCPALGIGEMIETDGRDFGKPTMFCGEDTSMASGEIDLRIEALPQNGREPAERPIPAVSGPAVTRTGDLWELEGHKVLCGWRGRPSRRHRCGPNAITYRRNHTAQ